MKRVMAVELLEEKCIGEIQELSAEAKPSLDGMAFLVEACRHLRAAADILHEREDFEDEEEDT
jgi:hypothetical protein